MNKSASNNERIEVGGEVELDDIVQMPGLLQLSFGRTYTVLSVGRANNPANDNIYVRNDHGRVVPYLARIFKPIEKLVLVIRADAFDEGLIMANISESGEIRQIILGFPETRQQTEDGETFTGIYIYSMHGIEPGTQSSYFAPSLFQPYNIEISLN